MPRPSSKGRERRVSLTNMRVALRWSRMRGGSFGLLASKRSNRRWLTKAFYDWKNSPSHCFITTIVPRPYLALAVCSTIELRISGGAFQVPEDVIRGNGAETSEGGLVAEIKRVGGRR